MTFDALQKGTSNALAVHAPEARILLVDDTRANSLFLERLLNLAGYQEVRSCSEATAAIETCRQFQPDIILLDLHMSGLSGFDLLAELRQEPPVPGYFPILVFTADTTGEAKRRALELGATDFLVKPGDATEILFRVRNFLDTRKLHLQLAAQNDVLERRVEERTRKLREAHFEMVERLALAAEYRDDDTGDHCRRVADLAESIALRLGMPAAAAETLRYGALLHDIGKVGVEDAILHKPSRLTDEEFERIQKHTLIGSKILEGSKCDILQMACEIALSHHERWDGSGYPKGLAGNDIPLSGRIVAVADVFDALTSLRPYKASWSDADALSEIRRLSGSQFDPEVVDAFFKVQRLSAAA